ncbi:MAG: nucleotidyltransferase family protein, partial [Acidobacteriota bacterium]
NQAHLHTYNEDAPYRDTVDSFSRWAETVSTVGVTLRPTGRVELAAPAGLDDLIGMVLRPNPHPDADREVFDRRLREKGWRELWPKVRLASEINARR